MPQQLRTGRAVSAEPAGIGEDPPQARLPATLRLRRAARRPRLALLALGGDIHDVLDADAAVATAGQPTEGEYAVFAEPVNELAGDSEDVGGLRGGDLPPLLLSRRSVRPRSHDGSHQALLARHFAQVSRGCLLRISESAAQSSRVRLAVRWGSGRRDGQGVHLP